MLRRRSGLPIIFALAVAAGSTHAAADNFGAIAFSKDDGAHGYSYDYPSRAAAENSALQRCSGSNCNVVIWFRNACAALAVGTGNGYGSGWAGSRAEAENIALDVCANNTSSCGIRAWSCTTR